MMVNKPYIYDPEKKKFAVNQDSPVWRGRFVDPEVGVWESLSVKRRIWRPENVLLIVGVVIGALVVIAALFAMFNDEYGVRKFFTERGSASHVFGQ